MDDTTLANTNWGNNWELDLTDRRNLEGGQGSVKKVRNKANGVQGALKELHGRHLSNTERRFRMQQEVNALQAMGGQFTPHIYESNADHWQNKDVPLYAVLEWIEGTRLDQYVGGNPRQIDEALEVVGAILSAIGACHRLEIFHRDLKPDNIILRDGKISEPVLIDFGMAWCRPDDDQQSEFETPLGQELGNRFLRLPEYAANRHVRDSRSDLTVLVGLLFYLVTGQQPRMLADAHNKMPHELDIIPASLRQDRRWPKLSRLFNVGFQPSLDGRFQSPEQFQRTLSSLEPTVVDNDSVARELAQIGELLKEKRVSDQRMIASTIKNASHELVKAIDLLARSSGFDFQGAYRIQENGLCCITTYAINLRDMPEPRVEFTHVLRSETGDYIASFHVAGTGNRQEYYRGPLADTASLSEAVRMVAARIFGDLLAAYRQMLTEAT